MNEKSEVLRHLFELPVKFYPQAEYTNIDSLYNIQ